MTVIMTKHGAQQRQRGNGLSRPDLLPPRRILLGGPPQIASALNDFSRIHGALANELQAAELAGLNAPGAGVDAHRHRVLIERCPGGELKVVKRLRPFRWAAATT